MNTQPANEDCIQSGATGSVSLGELTACDTIHQAVELVDAAYDFRQHPYIKWTQDEATSRESFLRTQVAFRYAIEYFSQALTAALARVPAIEDRVELAKNVAEEHGHGHLEKTHKYTFLVFLRALGASEEQIAAPCPIGVSAFAEGAINYCLTHTFPEAAACVGIIEHLYVGISGDIDTTVYGREWTLPDSHKHYAIHAKLDVIHARDLFDLAVSPGYADHARGPICRSLLLGAHLFWSLYDYLYASRD